MKTKTLTYYTTLSPFWYTSSFQPVLSDEPYQPRDGQRVFRVTVAIPCFPEPDGTIEAEVKEIKP